MSLESAAGSTWAATEVEAIDAAPKRCPDLVTADPAPRRRPLRRPAELEEVPAAVVVSRPFDGGRLRRAIAAAKGR